MVSYHIQTLWKWTWLQAWKGLVRFQVLVAPLSLVLSCLCLWVLITQEVTSTTFSFFKYSTAFKAIYIFLKVAYVSYVIIGENLPMPSSQQTSRFHKGQWISSRITQIINAGNVCLWELPILLRTSPVYPLACCNLFAAVCLHVCPSSDCQSL